MVSVNVNETYNEDKPKKMLESILTDDKIQELNEGHLADLTKEEILKRIIDVIKSPSDYEDLFFRPAKIASSSFQRLANHAYNLKFLLLCKIKSL